MALNHILAHDIRVVKAVDRERIRTIFATVSPDDPRVSSTVVVFTLTHARQHQYAILKVFFVG